MLKMRLCVCDHKHETSPDVYSKLTIILEYYKIVSKVFILRYVRKLRQNFFYLLYFKSK